MNRRANLAILPAMLMMVVLSACQAAEQAEPVMPATAPEVASAVMVDRSASDEEEHMVVTDSVNQASFAAGNRDFALAAFQRIVADPRAAEHLLISPHSILSALAMVYAGADGDTREQMRQSLRFALDEPALHVAFSALAEALSERARQERQDQARGFELAVVNRLWGQHDGGFLPEYLGLVERHYGAGVELLDFESDPDGIRRQVNAWVEEQTRDRIRDLLPEGSVNQDTRMILVNAIYFLASWQHAFEPEMTRDQAFTTGSGRRLEVPMMQRTDHMATYLGEETIAVSLPYVGREVSLLALMPAEPQADFDAWLGRMDREGFDALVAGLEPRRVALAFPKFSGGSSFRLADLLRNMGMPLAFSPTEADFRRMNGVGPGVLGESLYIDEVFHQTFIDLDEAGTEAAAATAVVMMRLTAIPAEEQALEIRFDRPFVYAIYDHPTATLLFLGRVLNPVVD